MNVPTATVCPPTAVLQTNHSPIIKAHTHPPGSPCPDLLHLHSLSFRCGRVVLFKAAPDTINMKSAIKSH